MCVGGGGEGGVKFPKPPNPPPPPKTSPKPRSRDPRSPPCFIRTSWIKQHESETFADRVAKEFVWLLPRTDSRKSHPDLPACSGAAETDGRKQKQAPYSLLQRAQKEIGKSPDNTCLFSSDQTRTPQSVFPRFFLNNRAVRGLRFDLKSVYRKVSQSSGVNERIGFFGSHRDLCGQGT